MLDYSVEMDDNDDGIFSEVASGVTAQAHLETGLSEGNAYSFRVRSRTAVGFSATYSTVFTIRAATVPSKPATPSTALNGDQTLVIVDWTIPTDTGGLPIDGYKVDILTSDGTTYAKDLLNCDAETDS